MNDDAAVWPRRRPDAVFFDIGDTLVDASAIRRRATETASAWLSERSSCEADAFATSLWSTPSRAREADVNNLWALPMARWRHQAATFGISPSLAYQASAIYRRSVRESLRPDPSLHTTMRQLTERGVELGIISDGTLVEQLDTLDLLGLTGFFSAIVISDSEGLAKPARVLFERAANALPRPIEPGRLWYVGDDYERDFEGASEAGWTAVLLRSSAAPGDGDRAIRSIGSIQELPGLIRELP